MPQDHLPSAVIAVHRGQLDLARQHAELGVTLRREQFRGQPVQHMAVLGLAARWSGDQAAAREWFEKADRQAAELGWGEPSVRWWTADYCELLLEAGRIADGVRLVDGWEADAARVGRQWVLAHATRCRGLIAAAQADVDSAARFSSGRSRPTKGSGIPTAERERCWRSASSIGACGRSGTPARRCRQRSRSSSSRGGDVDGEGTQRARAHRRAAARGRAHARRAAGRHPRCRGPYESGSRRRALPDGADGGQSPFPCATPSSASVHVPSLRVSCGKRVGAKSSDVLTFRDQRKGA